MAFIEGTNRFQTQLLDFFDFDNLISFDNPVRVIDAFVNSLNLEKLGFVTYSGDNPGQKPYHTDILLKIHIYCFFNGIQSSRKQERECARNIELIWITGNLKPDHSTIAKFFKTNSNAIKNVFYEFTKVCQELNLCDFKLSAIDGTKIKANCSKKNAYTVSKIDTSLALIDEKIAEYMSNIDNDNCELEDAKKDEFNKKLELIKERKVKLTNLKQHMIDNDIKEVCTTDTDAKVMKNHSNIEPCYNVQSVVDSKEKLIVEFDVTNQANDIGLLKPMADKLTDTYNLNSNTEANATDDTRIILADAGYYKSSDLLSLNNNNTKAYVPKPKTTSASGDNDFSKDAFNYIPEEDIYVCPFNRKLTFSRKSKETRNGGTNHYKIYTSTSCLGCPHINKCTTSINGRSIKRNILDDKLLRIDKEYAKNSSYYKLRKELVEHPFGTIKRSLGFTHVHIKGLHRVASWAASVFLAYDLKRVLNIVGFNKLMQKFTTV